MSKTYTKAKKDSVRTPRYLLSRIQKQFFGYNVYFDCCPYNENFNAEKHRCGLSYEWPDCTFVNPPYSRAATFLKYAANQWIKNKTRIVLLVKLDILGTKTFQKYHQICTVYVCNDRIKFQNYSQKAQFFSVVIVFGDVTKKLGTLNVIDVKK